jgi:hypothetical protein
VAVNHPADSGVLTTVRVSGRDEGKYSDEWHAECAMSTLAYHPAGDERMPTRPPAPGRRLADMGDELRGGGRNDVGSGRCCRSYGVEVTVRDVRELAAGTALHPQEFVLLHENGTDHGFRLRRGLIGYCRSFPATWRRGAVDRRTPDGPDVCDLATYERDLIRSYEAWHEHNAVIKDWTAAVDATTREMGRGELFDFVLDHVPQPA